MMDLILLPDMFSMEHFTELLVSRGVAAVPQWITRAKIQPGSKPAGSGFSGTHVSWAANTKPLLLLQLHSENPKESQL